MASVARKDAKRFSSLNLGTTYKGAKPEAKGAGNKGGFQSLGKIQGKRMPGPAQLPSLRKENAGNDPNVNLVPQAGGGWGVGKEDEVENKEVTSQPSSQPVTQTQDVQAITQPSSSTGREPAGGKKEGIWATPEANSVGPASAPPNQHFKKNFPSLEEREARGTKRTITNELHHDSPQVPFNEMDNMSSVPATTIPPGHYHFAPRPRPPYAAAPSHMGPPYLPRGMPPFRHGMPPPPTDYNHYGHHGGGYRGYPPQQQPGPPPNSAAGGQYQYPVPRYHIPPNSSLPHNMDPYQDGQAKLVKSEELKSLELPDEDDDVGGWAGYHEEVDYSKKVVFNDSSDDEEGHQDHQRQPKRKDIHERESTNREARMQEAPPLGTVEQPHLHADQSSKHLHVATTDLQYFQQQHSQSGGHYPLYYTAHPPQRGYPITVASRPVEKERPHQIPQSDLQPIWQQNRRPKGVPPPDSAWGEDKLVTSPAVTQSSTVQSIGNEQMESIQQQLEQTTLNDSDSTAEKKHVKFHLEQQQQPVAPPAARQPLKIMMRDMKLSGDNDQTSTTENFHHGNMGKPPYHHRPNDTDHQHTVNVERSLQQQQKISAWKAADRGPITTPRTLYEPEGDKSAKKFNALIKQTSSERGKRGSASESTPDGEQVQSPSGDIKILKAEEKQSKGKPTATTPTDETTPAHNKPQQTSHKNKTGEASTTTAKKGSKKERPSFRQYQPPAAREQDEQSYTENKGSGRRSNRQDYNYEQQQGDSRSQRRRDRQPSEGKCHSDKRYSDSKHQTEGKPHSEGKTQAEGKHHPEGKRQVDGSNRRENRSRKERETSKDPPASTHEQTEQHTATPADVSKEDVSKSEHSQDDKTKQSGKDTTQSKGAGSSSGDTKHRKKNTTSSGPAAQKSDSSVPREKSSRRGGGRSRNTDDWYYSEDYYNQWYASGGYDDYYYYYDDYNYYSDRRAPSGRQKQQQQQQSYDAASNSKGTSSERRDTGGKKSHQQQQQQTERGANRPARTRGGDRKDESSEEKAQQHRSTKDKSREVSGEEVSRSKAAEEADIRDRGRRRDSKQHHQESNVDKKRSSRTAGTKGTAPQSSTASTSKSSASHDGSGRGQSRSSSNKTNTSQDHRPQQPSSDDQQHTTASESSSGKKEPTIKDKAASAKMAIVDINSPTVFVIDEEQTIPTPSTAPENDDFIRVTSKKEKREMKELEKHRQQEKQRKAEEEENKKKQHSSRKSSQKTKHHQQHQLQEQSLPHEDQSLSTTNWSTTATTATVSNASIWTESFTSLLNEGVNQTSSYMAAAHSTLMAPGDYQLFPTSSYSSSSAPLAHLSAAVDSSVAQDLPTTAAQGHSLSESDVKPTGVGRPDTSSAGHGAIRTDLPLSKSHSSASVGGAIGRGRGSSGSRAPGSNRGSSSRDSSKKLPGSSSDSKLTSSSGSPKISKPSSAVRSKPSAATAANSLTSSDKVTSSATVTNTPMMATTANRRKMTTDVSLARPTQHDGGSSKRAGSGQPAGGKSNKQNLSKSPSARRQQPHPHPAAMPSSSSSSNVSNVSYANAVKSSPSSQDKKPSTANKPVAYVKPTASTVTTATPVLTEQDDESLSRMSSFPTAQLSQELMPEEPVMVVTNSVEQQVKVTSEPTAVVVAPSPAAPPAFVPPVVSKSSSPAAAAAGTVSSKASRLSFTPFTFVASPSTTGVTSHQASIVQVTTVTSTVTSHPAAQRSHGDTGKEGVAEVEEVASKRIRLGPAQRTTNVTDHSTKLNISAVPFIPSCTPATVPSHHHKPAVITTTAAAANVTTPSVAATPPFCKVSMPTACYQLPGGSMVPANMVPLIMPHPQMGSGYAMSQQTPYPFHTAVPSHAYPMPAHPPSIVGLAYAGYPMQQPAMVPPPAVTNSGIPPSAGAPSYNMYVPQSVSGANIIPPPVGAAPPFPPPAVVAAHHAARMEQRKKEEQMKALNDTKRFFEQSAASSSVAKQQPTLYKYPPATVKQQLPVTTEGGRRTLLENPPVAMAMSHHPVGHMMNRPIEMTTINNSPSTGSKRKRRPPLLQQIPVTNNITMTTPWDKPTNTMY